MGEVSTDATQNLFVRKREKEEEQKDKNKQTAVCLEKCL